MRPLIVSINLTLDGFMAGPDGELDWHFDYWDDEMAAALTAQLEEADTILLGRVTYETMAAYWPGKDVELPTTATEFLYARMMNSYRKVVFSNALSEKAAGIWGNTVVLRGSVAEEVCRLKQKSGKSMIVYGSGGIVSALLQARCELVDEYRLWIHPVLIRRGKPFFQVFRSRPGLELVSIQPLDSGVAILRYRPITQQIKWLDR